MDGLMGVDGYRWAVRCVTVVRALTKPLSGTIHSFEVVRDARQEITMG